MSMRASVVLANMLFISTPERRYSAERLSRESHTSRAAIHQGTQLRAIGGSNAGLIGLGRRAATRLIATNARGIVIYQAARS